MTDLRKAAEMALEALESNSYGNTWIGEISRNAITALRQALEHPDDAAWAKHLKEPMSEKSVHESDTMERHVSYVCPQCHWTLEQPGQEPVAWMYVNKDGECEQIEFGEAFDDPSVTLLYTAPPKREWIGLTDEEVDCLEFEIGHDNFLDFARAIEAKLKERNRG